MGIGSCRDRASHRRRKIPDPREWQCRRRHPSPPLTDGCPTYEREGIESEEVIALREMDLTEHMTAEGDLTKDFLLLLRSQT